MPSPKPRKRKGLLFLSRQVDANQGGNQRITAFIYKEDAKKRVLQSPDAIPADSEAGRAAIAKGGEEAKKVEIPGVATAAQALKWAVSLKRNPRKVVVTCYAARRYQN
jgi:hypothetical protein